MGQLARLDPNRYIFLAESSVSWDGDGRGRPRYPRLRPPRETWPYLGNAKRVEYYVDKRTGLIVLRPKGPTPEGEE